MANVCPLHRKYVKFRHPDLFSFNIICSDIFNIDIIRDLLHLRHVYAVPIFQTKCGLKQAQI